MVRRQVGSRTGHPALGNLDWATRTANPPAHPSLHRVLDWGAIGLAPLPIHTNQ